MALMLKNSNGQESFSFTIALVSFVIVMCWLALSIVEKIGPFHIRPFDSSAALAVLSTTFSLYFGRRAQEIQEKKLTSSSGSSNSSPPSE